MESRHARRWRAFVRDLLGPAGLAHERLEGVCFLGRSGAVEFADGCLAASPALALELRQLPALFRALERREVLAERALHAADAPEAAPSAREPLVPPAIRLDGDAFVLLEASAGSARAVARARGRALLALELRVGVLVLLLHPAALRGAWARLDAACADLR